MPRPSGFLYEQHGDASVTITHHKHGDERTARNHPRNR